MTVRLSTGLRDKMLGMVAEVKACLIGTSLALVDGGASADTITHSGNGFVTAGFAPGDILFLQGATTSANDAAITGVVITSVAAGTLTIPTGSVSTAETFAAGTVLAVAKGGSLRDVMKDGILYLYSGSQPSTADSAVTGTELVKITASAGSFSSGSFTNGLELGDAASAAISKVLAETWQGVAGTSGYAGWFRMCANATDAGGASTTLPRIDGSVGTSGADLQISSTSIVAGKTYTIDDFTLSLPAYYGE